MRSGEPAFLRVREAALVLGISSRRPTSWRTPGWLRKAGPGCRPSGWAVASLSPEPRSTGWPRWAATGSLNRLAG